MKKIISYCAIIFVFVMTITSCSLFKKTQKNVVTIPPPPKSSAQPKDSVKAEKKTKVAPFNVPAFAYEVKKPEYHIAIFAPLYIDSALDNSNNFRSNTLPRYMMPGLEFYEGAQLALDSLQSQNYNLTVYVVDTKSAKAPLSQMLNNAAMDSIDLIIGAVNLPELKQISEFAEKHQVNFVSATYPNDGNINKDPFLVIVNSTLKMHCNAIINYVEKYFSNSHVIIFRRTTTDENVITNYLKEAGEKSSRKISLDEVMYDTTWTANDFAKHLQAGKNNVCIITTLEENTAENISQKLASLTTSYQINIIGMPTWDGFRGLYGTEYKNLPIFYSTPYYNEKKDAASIYLMNNFANQYNLPHPSDMAFKGFDITYFFVKLLHEYGLYFNTRLNDRRAHLITNYNFQPVYLNKFTSNIPDYFENTHLYFVKIYNGVAYSAGSVTPNP